MDFMLFWVQIIQQPLGVEGAGCTGDRNKNFHFAGNNAPFSLAKQGVPKIKVAAATNGRWRAELDNFPGSLDTKGNSSMSFILVPVAG
jgi:hypothetical protein